MFWLLACTPAPEPESVTMGPADSSAELLDTQEPHDTGTPGVLVEAFTLDDPWTFGLGLRQPVSGRVRSGFGPRVIDDQPDFHLGVDIPGRIGDPLYAVADGTVFRIEPASNGESAMLYIEHTLDTPLSFHGQEIDRFYSVYVHVDGFEVDAEGEPVQEGQVIARLGDSGAKDPHLHFELRLGTHCTLRYATEHPESTCGGDWDPAINPLHAIPGRSETPLDVRLNGDVLRVSWEPGDADLNRIATDLGVLDFDHREGLDATSLEALDRTDLGWVRLEAGDNRLLLVFAETPAWIEVTDIAGEGWSLRPPG